MERRSAPGPVSPGCQTPFVTAPLKSVHPVIFWVNALLQRGPCSTPGQLGIFSLKSVFAAGKNWGWMARTGRGRGHLTPGLALSWPCDTPGVSPPQLGLSPRARTVGSSLGSSLQLRGPCTEGSGAPTVDERAAPHLSPERFPLRGRLSCWLARAQGRPGGHSRITQLSRGQGALSPEAGGSPKPQRRVAGPPRRPGGTCVSPARPGPQRLAHGGAGRWGAGMRSHRVSRSALPPEEDSCSRINDCDEKYASRLGVACLSSSIPILWVIKP